MTILNPIIFNNCYFFNFVSFMENDGYGDHELVDHMITYENQEKMCEELSDFENHDIWLDTILKLFDFLKDYYIILESNEVQTLQNVITVSELDYFFTKY
jgi:hypothetical protein